MQVQPKYKISSLGSQNEQEKMKSKPGGHFFFKWFLSISSSYITHMVKSENEKSIKGRPWLQQLA
ncbi:hypothetical protein TYRP_011664 [Tyrophagus putrescentiae]|nr:hypothetical protein TYRP_011664 [Tyrophagus putrescentiae]